MVILLIHAYKEYDFPSQSIWCVHSLTIAFPLNDSLNVLFRVFTNLLFLRWIRSFMSVFHFIPLYLSLRTTSASLH